MAYPSPRLLQNLLRYDPETGRLFWLHRKPEMFTSTPARSAERLAKTWNSRCADQEAFVRKGRCCAATVLGQTLLAHRVAWAIFHGRHPDGEIDHINGNPRDNRIKNLRVVTRKENCRNTAIPSTNRSGVMGVSWHRRRKRWRADIKCDGIQRHLGYFTDKSAAISARKLAERELGFHPNHGRRA